MMKKYYRNRYSSFLKTLADRKQEEAKEAEQARQKEAERKQKLANKVLRGQAPASKVFNKVADNIVLLGSPLESAPGEDGTVAEAATPGGLPVPSPKVAAQLASKLASTHSSLQTRSHLRNSSLAPPRSSTQREFAAQAQASRAGERSSSRMRSADRSLTQRKQVTSKFESGEPAADEAFDEEREQELLRQAAERKERAEKIRAR